MQNSKRHNKHHLFKLENINYNGDWRFDKLRIKGSDKRIQIKKIRLTEKEMIEDGLDEYWDYKN